MVYFGFIIVAALVVFLSIKLSKYVDLLDKTTKISGAFIGGVLLAAVTSLPELFTSISATVILKENSLVLGNILGSNLFNLAVLGAILIVFFKGFQKAKIGRHHLITMSALLVIYGLIAVAMFWVDMPKLGWFNIISLLILAIYVFVIIKTPKTEEASESIDATLTLKQIIARFIIAAVLLVACSVVITYLTDDIATKLDLGKTFAGALLLGFTTSLPEVVSTFSLCKRGNFNAAAGNILGSNTFNCLILFIADMLSFSKGSTNIYIPFNEGAAGMQAMLLLFLGIAATILTALTFIIKTYSKRPQRLLNFVSTISLNSLCTITYILFLILSLTLV